MSKITHHNGKLLLVFVAIATQILVMSYSYTSGGLTADSKNYLYLAQNILDGHGFWVKDVYAENGRSFFATWPVGYSVYIAGIASLLHIDLFLASKLLHIILIGFTLFIFARVFGKDAYLFGSVFFLDSIIRLTYRTWVQTPFLIGFILLALSLYYFYYNRKQLRWLFAIIVICLFMFSVRYVSLTSLIAIGVLGCYLFYKKDYNSFFRLAGIGLIILSASVFYLYLNYLNTGYITGHPRIGNPEETLWMIKRLISRLLEEAKIPLIAVTLTWIAIKYFNAKPLKKITQLAPEAGKIWPFFVLVALTYLPFIIILRFNMRFDDFGGRMFGPASILLVLALIDYLRANSRYFPIFKKSLLLALVGSFIYHTPYKAAENWFKDKPTYVTHRQELDKTYAELEPNSIVLFGHYDLIYIRNDVQSASAFPFYGDYFFGKEYDGAIKEDIAIGESVENYAIRRCKLPISAIYIDTKRIRTGNEYNPVQEFADKHPNKRFVKLAECNNGKATLVN